LSLHGGSQKHRYKLFIGALAVARFRRFSNDIFCQQILRVVILSESIFERVYYGIS
jgi:hypothetical protein